MSITNVGTNSTASANPGTGVTWNLSQTVTVGNLLVVALGGTATLAGATVTASGNAMTSCLQSGAGPLVQVFKLESCPSGVSQVVIAGITSTDIAAIAAEFNPTSIANDNVSDAGVLSPVGSYTTTTIATNFDDLIIVAMRMIGSTGNTWTINSPYIMAGQLFAGASTTCVGLAWGEQSTRGNYSASGTSTDAGHSSRVVIGALKVGPSAGDDVISFSGKLRLNIS